MTSTQFRIDPEHTVLEMIQQSLHRLMIDGVQFELTQAEIRLTGRVSSWRDKQLVQETLRDITKSRQIRNELCVIS